MPSPKAAFSGHEGMRWLMELLREGMSVWDDKELEERHLNDISEKAVCPGADL